MKRSDRIIALVTMVLSLGVVIFGITAIAECREDDPATVHVQVPTES